MADSVNPGGIRVTTFELCYPLIVHAELMTHRVFSRNAQSNRAIPVERLISMTESDPFIPAAWPKNGKGMQPGGYLEGRDAHEAEYTWRDALTDAVEYARKL